MILNITKTSASNGYRTRNHEKKTTTAEIDASQEFTLLDQYFCAIEMHTKYEVNMLDSWEMLHDGILHLQDISSPDVHCGLESRVIYTDMAKSSGK